MTQLFANNAGATLASGITNVATSLTLATGKGALFPSPTGSDYFLLTLTQAATESSWERVKVTARAGDVLTIVRAQDGTAAAAWAGGDKAELRVGALEFNRMGGSQPFENGILIGDADQSAPASGVKFFSVRMAGTAVDPGLVMPAFRGMADVTSMVMPAPMAAVNYRWWRASGGSDGPQVFGGFYDTSGTSSSNGYNAGSVVGRQHHTTYITAASAGASAGVKGYTNYVARLTGAGQGGFFMATRIILFSGIAGTNGRMFVGLTDQNNDPLGGDATAMPICNTVGFYFNAADTNLKFMTGDGTTFATTDLGAGVPKTINYMYDLFFYCPPGGAKIYYRVDKTVGSTLTERAVEGSVTTNLPLNDVPLNKSWIRAGTSNTTTATIGVVQQFLSWTNN